MSVQADWRCDNSKQWLQEQTVLGEHQPARRGRKRVQLAATVKEEGEVQMHVYRIFCMLLLSSCLEFVSCR